MNHDENFCEFKDKWQLYKDKIRHGKLGFTAQFWIQYCDFVWILLKFLRAVKENNLSLFVYAISRMSLLMFSADHLHYARYLPIYYIQLKNLSVSHPGAELLLQECVISVA